MGPSISRAAIRSNPEMEVIMDHVVDTRDAELTDLGSVTAETKGIVGLDRDLDQSPKGGAGILED